MKQLIEDRAENMDFDQTDLDNAYERIYAALTRPSREAKLLEALKNLVKLYDSRAKGEGNILTEINNAWVIAKQALAEYGVE
jgi:hypothetical protein